MPLTRIIGILALVGSVLTIVITQFGGILPVKVMGVLAFILTIIQAVTGRVQGSSTTK